MTKDCREAWLAHAIRRGHVDRFVEVNCVRLSKTRKR
jgi:hypothetical protein